MALAAPSGPALHRVYGFRGQRLCSLQPLSRTVIRAVAYPALSGVTVLPLPGEDRSALHWIPEDFDDFRDATAMCLHPQGHMLAVADRRLACRVGLYEWPSRRTSQMLKDCAHVQVADMCWSRTGSHFAVLAGDPKHNMTVFADSGRGQLVPLVSQGDVPNDHQYSHVSFDPRNAMELCTSGGGQIAFWKIEENDRPGSKPKHRLVSIEGRVSVPNIRITCHTWLPSGQVLAGTKQGSFVIFDSASGLGDSTSFEVSAEVVSLITTKHCVVACCARGKVHCISLEATELLATFDSRAPGKTTSCVFTALDTFVIGTDAGAVVSIVLPGFNSASVLSNEEIPLLAPKVATCDEGFANAVSATLLPNEESLVALSADGIVRIRNVKNNSVEGRVAVGKGATDLIALSERTLMTVHRDATVRFVDVGQCRIVQQLRVLVEQEFASACVYAPRSRGCVAGHLVLIVFDLHIVILDTETRLPVGEVSVPDVFESILDVTFIDGQENLCAASTGNSSVVLLQLPSTFDGPSSGDTSIPKLEFEDIQVNRWRTELPFTQINVLSYFEGVGFNLLGASVDRDTKFSTVDLSLSPKRKDLDTKALKLPLSFKDHSKRCTYLTTINKKLLLTAGCDGRIVVRNVSTLASQGANPSGARKDDPAFIVCRHNSYAGGITNVSLCGDWLVAVGGDGSVSLWNVSAMLRGDAPKKPPMAIEMPFAPFGCPPIVALEDPPREEHFFLEKKRLEAEELDKAKHAEHRAEMLGRVAVLRDRLREIRAENQQAADDERVDTEDFLVTRDKSLFQTEVEGAIAAMRDEVKWHDLNADFVAHTLKTQCWDVMATKLTPLYGLGKPDLCVYSCHERRVPTAQLRVLRKLKFLRRVEETEREHRNVRELENLESSPVAEGEDESAAEPTPSPLLSMHTDLESKLPPPEQDANEDIQPYLYAPKLAFTRQRAVTQITLLESQSTNVLRRFNAAFVDLQGQKRGEIDKIRERNARSSIVQKELDDQSRLFEVVVHEDEDPDSLLEVKDSEVPADKSFDPEERRRVALEEAERERWRRQHGNDDSSERALKLWMDGRLEKEIKTLRVDVQEPEFAVEGNPKFVPLDERTDEQLRLYKEYEKKLKARTEEVAARRKLLQEELKTLQKENRDAAARFDAALEALLLDRLQTVQHLAKVDLYRVKLAQSVAMIADRDTVLAKLEQQRKLSEERAIHAATALERFAEQVRLKEQEHKSCFDREKHADKNLRALPPFCDHEESAERLVKTYNNWKKKTMAAAAGKGRGVKGEPKKRDKTQATTQAEQKIASNPDPFAFVDAEAEAKQRALQEEAAAAAAAVAKLEKPDGISEGLWDAFIGYVQDRVSGQREEKRLRAEVEEMKTERQRLEDLADQLRRTADDRRNEMLKFRVDTRDELYDTDDLRMYRQGQVEVPQPPVATDFADALLIHARDIHKLNEHIRERGEAKVECMELMKRKRGELREKEWEVERYQFQCQTAEMELRHLHTLKVTKQMQEFIHGGSEGYNERERAKLQAKIDHVRTTMSSKIEERKNAMRKVKRATKERELENQLLLEQVNEAQAIVDTRRSVRDLQSSELEKERHNRLMRDMRVTRKLEDVAKAQQDEMNALRKEIDRLRERTFPSFAVVSKRVIGNPDEA